MSGCALMKPAFCVTSSCCAQAMPETAANCNANTILPSVERFIVASRGTATNGLRQY
jgi:hypothetical protein